MGRRLLLIHRAFSRSSTPIPPSALALEQVHSHVKHPRTAILMAHARGVIVLAAAERGVPVVGYAASRIKKTLTGSGKAPKEQMQHAIRTELGLDRLPEPHDVADACAVALCHFQIARNLRGLWSGFEWAIRGQGGSASMPEDLEQVVSSRGLRSKASGCELADLFER